MKRVILLLIIIILLVTGCTTSEKSNPVTESERQKIISFTRQALEIEDKRNELMEYMDNNFHPMNYDTAVDRWFLRGVASTAPRGSYMTFYQLALLNHGDYYATPGAQGDLEGMLSLKNRLTLLDCPQSLHSVKDSLSQIYSAEIEQAQFQSEALMKDTHPIPIVYPDVTKDNLDYWQQSLPMKVEYHDEGMRVYYSEPIRKWWDVRQYLSFESLTALGRVWREGGQLTASEETKLRADYEKFPFGQQDFNMWLKQIRSLQEDYLEVMNKTGGFDVATARLESDWFAIQEFRLEVYTRWAEILQEHGVDPLEEGLTSFIK